VAGAPGRESGNCRRHTLRGFCTSAAFGIDRGLGRRKSGLQTGAVAQLSRRDGGPDEVPDRRRGCPGRQFVANRRYLPGNGQSPRTRSVFCRGTDGGGAADRSDELQAKVSRRDFFPFAE